MDTVPAVLCLLWSGLSLLALVVVRPLRRKLQDWVREILQALRYVLWELPLRAITGRRRPDYSRIGRLEVECSLGRGSANDCADEALLSAGKITVNQYRARQGFPPVPGPVTVDEWRHRSDDLPVEVQQTLASAYVQFSREPGRIEVAPWHPGLHRVPKVTMLAFAIEAGSTCLYLCDQAHGRMAAICPTGLHPETVMIDRAAAVMGNSRSWHPLPLMRGTSRAYPAGTIVKVYG